MYKHLIPKKDQLFRRQVKQAIEQRQQNPNIRTNKETNKKMQSEKKTHSTNGNCVGKHGNICSNKTSQRGSLQLVQGLYRVGRGRALGEFTGQDVHFLEQSETKQESYGTKLLLTGTRPCSVSRGHKDGSSAGQREPRAFPHVIFLVWLSLLCSPSGCQPAVIPYSVFTARHAFQLQNSPCVTSSAPQEKLLKSSLSVR